MINCMWCSHVHKIKIIFANAVKVAMSSESVQSLTQSKKISMINNFTKMRTGCECDKNFLLAKFLHKYYACSMHIKFTQ